MISRLTLLLPREVGGTKVEHKLVAYNGCFKWTSTNPDVVSVAPHPNVPCKLDPATARAASSLLHNSGDSSIGHPTDASVGGRHCRDVSCGVNVCSRYAHLKRDANSGTTCGDESLDDEGDSPYFQHEHESEVAPVCSSSVTVSVEMTQPGRHTSFVMAEEVTTGRMLRCEVFVDDISRIAILTTTTVMYRDDQQELRVEAFDKEGNLFSTTEGLQYQWTLVLPRTGGVHSAGGNVLDFVPFKDSHMDISPMLLEMEDRGVQSSSVLVKGIQTGKTAVSSRLVEPGYAEVPVFQVTISVLEPLQIRPAFPVYVAVGSRVSYELETFRRDRPHKIAMPNSQYEWSVRDDAVASVDDTGRTHATRLGYTDVEAHYVNMTENMVSSRLHVVEPDYISLRLVPVGNEDAGSSASAGTPSPVAGTNRFLVTGRTYRLVVDVFDGDSHKLYTTDSLQFEVTLSQDHFDVKESSPNSDTHTVVPTLTGETTITATLSHLINELTGERIDLSRPITAQQPVVITAPIRLLPPDNPISLPSVHRGVVHEYTMRAEGGSGVYAWYSANYNTVKATKRSDVSDAATLRALDEGTTSIMVMDKNNALNKATTAVTVGVPAGMKYVTDIVETEVGGVLHLPLGMWDQADRHFHNCSALPLVWEFSDPSVFELVPAASASSEHAHGRSCLTLRLRALREGGTTLTGTLEGDGKGSNSSSIHASIRVFAYRPLEVLHPAPCGALVTLGSTATLSFEGGPHPWHLRPEAYFEEVVSSISSNETDDVAASISRVIRVSHTARRSGSGTLRARHAYHITCLAYGVEVMTITVGNRPTATNPTPATSTTTATFACRRPSSLLLVPDSGKTLSTLEEEEVAEAEYAVDAKTKCEKHAVFPALFTLLQSCSAVRIPLPTAYQIRNDRLIHIHAFVTDSSGMLFTNFSSLNMEWATSDESVVLLSHPEPSVPHPMTHLALSHRTAANPQHHQHLDDPESIDGGVVEMRSFRRWEGRRYTRGATLSATESDVVISGLITGYDQSILQSAGLSSSPLDSISTTLTLSLLSNVELVPSLVSLYNHPGNLAHLRTLKGSGVYRFSPNDSRAVSLSYTDAPMVGGEDGGVGVVEVHPIREGVVQISARDLCLEGSLRSYSTVRIASVDRIVVRVRDMLRLGDDTDMEVHVYAADGHRFTKDQIRLMNLVMSRDGGSGDSDKKDGSLRVLSIAPASSDTVTRFLVRGVSVGVGGIRVSSLQTDGRMVSSDTARVHVFAPLRLSPRKVVLLPHTHFQLRTQGGPPVRADLSFSLSSSSLAVVDDTGLITTLAETGSARVEAEVWGTDSLSGERHLFGEDAVDLVVREMLGIRIFASTNTVLRGEEMVVRVVGVNGETPFTYGTAPITFEWSAVNSEVVRLLSTYERANITLDADDGAFTARVTGRQSGSTRISVRISACPQHPTLCGMSASVQIRVVEPLVVLSGNRMLLPPHTQGRIFTNKDHTGTVKYEVLRNCETDPIEITASGVVSSTGSCNAIVLVRDGVDVCDAVVQVVVKPVHMVDLSPQVPVHYAMPVGSTMDMRVVMRDDLGVIFSRHTGTSLESEMNRVDIVASLIANDTVALTALRPGEVIIHVSLVGVSGSLEIDHYVQIRVGNAIFPSFPVVHSGGHIQFATTIPHDRVYSSKSITDTPSSDNSTTVWSAENPNLIVIDPHSGSADAVSGVGRTTVYHKSNVHTYTQVTIVHVEEIRVRVGPAARLITSVVEAGKGESTPRCPVYRLPLEFFGPNGLPLTATSSSSSSSAVSSSSSASASSSSSSSSSSAASSSSASSSSSSSSSPVVLVDHRISAQCSVAEEDWATARVQVDGGAYTCVVSPRCDTALPDTARRGEFPNEIHLLVSASDTASTYTIEHHQTLPFAPAFFVVNAPLLLELTDSKRTHSFEVVSGGQKVIVSSGDDRRLSVTRDAAASTNTLSAYELTVLPSATEHPFDISVEIKNPASGQQHSIKVSYQPFVASSKPNGFAAECAAFNTDGGGRELNSDQVISSGNAVATSTTTPSIVGSLIVILLACILGVLVWVYFRPPRVSPPIDPRDAGNLLQSAVPQPSSVPVTSMLTSPNTLGIDQQSTPDHHRSDHHRTGPSSSSGASDAAHRISESFQHSSKSPFVRTKGARPRRPLGRNNNGTLGGGGNRQNNDSMMNDSGYNNGNSSFLDSPPPPNSSGFYGSPDVYQR